MTAWAYGQLLLAIGKTQHVKQQTQCPLAALEPTRHAAKARGGQAGSRLWSALQRRTCGLRA